MSVPARAEVVVVGGGITGTSIAFHLAEAGVEVCLLERSELASGSTSRAAGGIRAQFSDPLNILLGLRSLEAFARFGERPGAEIDLDQVGYLFLLDRPEDVPVFERSVALQNELGLPSRVMTVEDAGQLSPLAGLEGVLAATFCPLDGTANPEAVVQGYAGGARRHGATVVTGCTVTGVELDDDEIRSLRTEQGPIETGTLVCAAGVWSPELARMAGFDLPVEPVFRDNPNHPGAAHVLIHCYDDPIHAPLGLAAARAYSKIAPDAAHAQHMTTHIFLALGMWDEVVSQNELASGRDRASWTANHYTAWLGYGYLQQGRYGDALRHLNLMHKNMDWSRPRQRAELALMRADYVVNTERWDGGPLQGGKIDLAEARLRDKAVDAFVFGLSAVKRGDRAGAERNLADLVTFSQMRAAIDTGPEKDRVPSILEKELRALLRQADGAGDDAVALLREATALEDAMPLEFGPPAVVKPSHELLCEVLLQAARPREAQVECARALRLAPKRARSLLGLGRAAAAAGDLRTAARAYGDLRAIWHRADSDLPGLAEAVRFLSMPSRSEKGGS